MLVLSVYLLGQIHKVSFALLSILLVFVLATIVSLINCVDSNHLPNREFWAVKASKFTKITYIILLLWVLLPSEKTSYTMAGAYVAQKVVEDPRSAEIGNKVVKIINQRLDSYIEEGIKRVSEPAKAQ
jgi:beta-lactamase regulating signal transducer with metallopeptidase domain